MSFEEFKKKIAEETLIKVGVQAILLLATFIGGTILATFKLTSVFSDLAPYKTVILIAGISIGLVITFFFYRSKKSKFRPSFERIDSDFVIERIEIRYQWKSLQEIIYSRHYRLRAIKNDVDHFSDKFRWSADGKCDVLPAVSGHRIDRHPPEVLHDFFDIYFDRTYRKGDIINTGAIWQLEDLKDVSRPFISRTIEHPTEELVMIVELPAALGVESLSGEEAPSAGAKRNIKGVTLPLINGKCEWPVTKPIKLLHHYQLRWKWKNR